MDGGKPGASLEATVWIVTDEKRLPDMIDLSKLRSKL